MSKNEKWCGVCRDFVAMRGTITEHYTRHHPHYDQRSFQTTYKRDPAYWDKVLSHKKR